MARIKYCITDNVGEWTLIENDRADSVEISLTPEVSGYVIIDNVAYRVSAGKLCLPSHALSDGEYRLCIDTEGKRISLEGFAISGGRITMLPTTDEAIRRLLSRVRYIEGEIKNMKTGISDLKKRTEGHHIFT